MDINLTEEQEMLKKMARDYLTEKCPGTLVRELIEDEKGYRPEMWRDISELGWVGLALPAKYGGADGSFIDLAILLEEMGRVAFPGPFFSTVVLGALTLLKAGSEEQKQEYLPKIARGELIATLALTEGDGSPDPETIELKATASKAGYVLNGTKMYVPDACAADLIICAARTGPGKNGAGITLFLVDRKNPGVECTMLKTVDGSKPCEVVFKDAVVPAGSVLGKVDQGWETMDWVLQRATAAKCVEMVGGAQRVLELAIAYSNDRRQFDRLIGTFQAIQHHCANMATDVDGMRLTAYQAAWMLSEGLPSRREAAIAKAWCSDAFRRVAFLGLRVHGGVGFMEDHDISVFYRKAISYENAFGDADYHRDVLSREMNLV